MARLEIELGAVNADLKRVLRESKIELSNFSKGLNFDTKGGRKLNDTLTTTKKLLSDITSSARQASTALSGLNKNDLRASILQQRQATESARAATAEYRAETARLTAELRQQNLATGQARTEAQNYRTESARLGAQMAALRAETMRNRGSITAASGSYREAQQRLTALGRSIREARDGFRSTSPIIQAQIREYRALNDRLQNFDSVMGNNQRRVGNYERALRGLGSTIGSFLGVTAFLAAARSVINSNSEISDSLADVRRTAGLTEKEVGGLTSTLKDLNTRSSLAELLDISVIGGQLGIAKDQLAGFTESIDQLAVTLKGELQGGAEGVAKSLGVLDNVFGVTAANGGDVRKAYNQIGSAILGLGQSGLATGDFLADFGERVGGLAKQAGIALPILLSYGAVLQENGVSAEVAGTAFKRLLSALSSNSAGFLKVAQLADSNLTLKEFNTIINTDTKKALELFFNGLKEGGSSTVAFNSILKSLKLSGAGVSQVIAAISNNQEDLNVHIKEATKDFEDATKSAEQFRLKNENLAASLSKLGNALTNISANPDSNLGKFFKNFIDSFTGGIKVVDILAGKIARLGDVIGELNDQRLVEQNEGNIIGVSKEYQREIDEAKARIALRKKTAIDLIKAGNTSDALKVGGKLNRDAILDIQAESNSNTILAKTIDRVALEEKKLGEIRKQYSSAKAGSARDEIGKRLIAQRELIRLLKIEAERLKPRSNAETPEGFTKGTKTKVVELKDIVGELNKALELTEVQFLDTFGDRNQGKIAAYQSAINAATNAFGRQSDAVKDLQKEQLKLYQLPSIASNISANTGIQNPALDSEGKSKLEVDLRTKQKPESLINKEAQEEAKIFKRELSRTVARFSEDLYQSLIDINTKGYKNFGEGLAGVAGDLAKSLTDSIGNVFMTAFSNQLTNVFEKAIGNLSAGEQAMAGAAVLLGSVVSGLFPKTSSGGQALGGALKGAGTGAVIGSAIPGIGTVLGAIGGGIIGALGGLFGAKKARKEEARRQAELEEQKKQTALLERANALAYTASITGRKTVNGIVTGVEVNEFGQITTKISGNDIQLVLERANRSRQRGV